jgi:uncharacterized tellurite resistance protein B-like protein
MFERILAFLKELPSAGSDGRKLAREDDPRVAAAALMYHVMDVDGVRQDAEWERMKKLLAEGYGLTGEALDALVAQGAEADQNAVDLYVFTSVLKRHLDEAARIEFIRAMWEIVFSDGELHELEDHTLSRIAELIGVDRRDRVLARRQVQGEAAAEARKSRSREED